MCIKQPLFQENLLRISRPLGLTRNGPSSCAAPYAMDEHPGPEIH